MASAVDINKHEALLGHYHRLKVFTSLIGAALALALGALGGYFAFGPFAVTVLTAIGGTGMIASAPWAGLNLKSFGGSIYNAVKSKFFLDDKLEHDLYQVRKLNLNRFRWQKRKAIYLALSGDSTIIKLSFLNYAPKFALIAIGIGCGIAVAVLIANPVTFWLGIGIAIAAAVYAAPVIAELVVDSRLVKNNKKILCEMVEEQAKYFDIELSDLDNKSVNEKIALFREKINIDADDPNVNAKFSMEYKPIEPIAKPMRNALRCKWNIQLNPASLKKDDYKHDYPIFLKHASDYVAEHCKVKDEKTGKLVFSEKRFERMAYSFVFAVKEHLREANASIKRDCAKEARGEKSIIVKDYVEQMFEDLCVHFDEETFPGHSKHMKKKIREVVEELNPKVVSVVSTAVTTVPPVLSVTVDPAEEAEAALPQFMPENMPESRKPSDMIFRTKSPTQIKAAKDDIDVRYGSGSLHDETVLSPEELKKIRSLTLTMS